MKNVLRIKYADFKKEMDSVYKANDEISTKDILDAYFRALSSTTNVLKDPELKELLFKQCKQNCGFLKTDTDLA